MNFRRTNLISKNIPSEKKAHKSAQLIGKKSQRLNLSEEVDFK